MLHLCIIIQLWYDVFSCHFPFVIWSILPVFRCDVVHPTSIQLWYGPSYQYSGAIWSILPVFSCDMVPPISIQLWYGPSYHNSVVIWSPPSVFTCDMVPPISTVEHQSNDHHHQWPSLLYDHILCDGQCFLFVRSLTDDHPSKAASDWVRWKFLPRGRPHRVFQNDCAMNVRCRAAHFKYNFNRPVAVLKRTQKYCVSHAKVVNDASR